MNIKNLLVLLSLLALLAAGYAPAQTPLPKPEAGQAFLIQDATVFYDANRNGHHDVESEPSTVTDAEGRYEAFLPEPQSVTLIGGHHRVFGATFEGVLTTPKSGRQITPSTTVLNFLIEALREASPSEDTDSQQELVRRAQDIFKRAFGIDANVDIMMLSPDKDIHLFSIDAALHSVMNDIAIAYETAYGEASRNTEYIYHEVGRSIAEYLLEHQDRVSPYFDFERRVPSSSVRSLIRDVGPRVVLLHARHEHEFDFDDIAFIAGPDIARRANRAAKLVHVNLKNTDLEALYAEWASFHDESVRVIENDIHKGLGLYWTYHEDHNKGWASIHRKYVMCRAGRMQSPINIVTANVKMSDGDAGKNGGIPLLEFHYMQELGLHALNNGHTLQIIPKRDNFILVNGERYDLIQFHFHQPSEEQIDGQHADMVAHFVHANVDRDIAVVAVFFQAGHHEEHPVLKTAFDHARALTEEEHKRHATVFFNFEDADVGYDINALLPERKAYFYYLGSLTTPPCLEGVKWFVMRESTRISDHQVEQYAHDLHLDHTNRTIQHLHGRLVSEMNPTVPEHGDSASRTNLAR